MLVLRPTVVYVTLAFVFGAILVAIVPPFRSVDELTHFYRVIQLARGDVIGMKISSWEAGGELPDQLISQMLPERDAAPNLAKKSSADDVWAHLAASPAVDWDRALQLRFVNFPNTVIYSPAAYWPSVIAVKAGMAFKLSPMTLFYLARLGTLLGSMLFFAFAIRLAPSFAWAYCFSGLVPMVLYLSCQVTADAMLTSSVFVLVALALRLAKARGNDRESLSLSTAIVMLAAMVSASKGPYLLMPLSLLPVCIRGLDGRGRRWIFGVALVVACLIPALGWTRLVQSLLVGPPHASAVEQAQLIVAEPLQSIVVVWSSILKHSLFWLGGIVGILGWNDTFLPVWAYPLFAAALIALWSIQPAGDHSGFQIQRNARWVIVAVSVITVHLLVIGMYLTWTPVGAKLIHGMNGRYFWPIIPVLALASPRIKSPLSNKGLAMTASLASLVSAAATVLIVLCRYYWTGMEVPMPFQ